MFHIMVIICKFRYRPQPACAVSQRRNALRIYNNRPSPSTSSGTTFDRLRDHLRQAQGPVRWLSLSKPRTPIFNRNATFSEIVVFLVLRSF
jgi:hypothetical protein